MRLIQLLYVTLQAYCSGTAIGNGGDPIFIFLESSREALLKTLEYYPDGDGKDHICHTAEFESVEKRKLCVDFLSKTRDQFFRLNRGQRKVPFVLRRNPLFVRGIDREPMPVAARTDLGERGVIEFHRPSIKYYTPKQLLVLLTHEFSHKVRFLGKYWGDHEPIPPFVIARDFIDKFALSIADRAVEAGIISHSFTLVDYFRCSVLFSDGRVSLAPTLVGFRTFHSDHPDRYTTGISRNPRDSEFSLPEYQSDLVFRVTISESASCLQPKKGSRSQMAIIRRHWNPSIEDQILAEKLILYNPICDRNPKPLVIYALDNKFQCLYKGTWVPY